MDIKKIIVLFLVLIALPLSTASYQKKYVVASGLYVRSKPSLKAKVIHMIPAGTRLSVRKSSLQQKIGKHNSYWYTLQYPLKGYVYGAFLADKRAASKRLVLCSSHYNMEVAIREKIILSSGYAIKIVHSMNGRNYEVRKGVYSVDAKGIRIVFRRAILWSYNKVGDKEKIVGAVQKEQKRVMEYLYWKPRLKGFIYKYHFGYLKGYKTNKKMTAFVYSEDPHGTFVSVVGFLTDRLWLKFNLPKECQQFLRNNKW